MQRCRNGLFAPGRNPARESADFLIIFPGAIHLRRNTPSPVNEQSETDRVARVTRERAPNCMKIDKPIVELRVCCRKEVEVQALTLRIRNGMRTTAETPFNVTSISINFRLFRSKFHRATFRRTVGLTKWTKSLGTGRAYRSVI